MYVSPYGDGPQVTGYHSYPVYYYLSASFKICRLELEAKREKEKKKLLHNLRET